MWTHIWRRPYGSLVRTTTLRRTQPFHNCSWVSKAYFDENSSSIKTRVKNIFYNYIKEQAEVLVGPDSSLSDTANESVNKFFQQNPAIAHRVNTALDIDNKLFTILSCKAEMVPSSVYMYFYNRLETPPSNTIKELLLSRLVYHEDYTNCWKICQETDTTLTEFEDFIDICSRVFEDKCDMYYGPYKLLFSLIDDIINSTLRKHIIDVICFKFGISKLTIQQVLEIRTNLQSVSTKIQLEQVYLESNQPHQYPIVLVLVLRKLIQVSETIEDIDESPILQSIHQHINTLLSRQGTMSSLIETEPTNSQLMNHLLQVLIQTPHKSWRFNHKDIVQLLEIFPSSLYSTVYDICIQSTKQLDPQALNTITKGLLESENIPAIYDILYRHNGSLSIANISQGLRMIMTYSKQQGFTLIEAFTSQLSEETYNTVMEEFILTKLNFSTDELETLCLILNRQQSKRSMGNLLRVIHQYGIDPTQILELYEKLITNKRIVSSKILLEINRSMVLRYNSINTELNSKCFAKLIDITFPIAIPEERLANRGTGHKLSSPLRKRLAVFHNTMRAIGQTIALTNLDDIDTHIRLIVNSIATDDTYLKYTPLQQKFILDNYIDEVMKFLSKTKLNQCEEIIPMIRQLSKISKEVADPLRKWMFKIIVLDDPLKCIKLLRVFENNKRIISNSIPAIISGILTNTKYNNDQKIYILKEFFNTIEVLGYRHRVRYSTGVELVKLFQKYQLSPESIEWFNDISNKHSNLRQVKLKYNYIS
ncbi:uncharacterized protein RJT21DRAFT_16049 [Scheffersomyces amazonensis]|uniref:uncharacterized protein n=1 Tax=Scheffersomyces amazonensis TaxID=1078765 RepID=UPI00315DCB5F